MLDLFKIIFGSQSTYNLEQRCRLRKWWTLMWYRTDFLLLHGHANTVLVEYMCHGIIRPTWLFKFPSPSFWTTSTSHQKLLPSKLLHISNKVVDGSASMSLAMLTCSARNLYFHSRRSLLRGRWRILRCISEDFTMLWLSFGGQMGCYFFRMRKTGNIPLRRHPICRFIGIDRRRCNVQNFCISLVFGAASCRHPWWGVQKFIQTSSISLLFPTTAYVLRSEEDIRCIPNLLWPVAGCSDFGIFDRGLWSTPVRLMAKHKNRTLGFKCLPHSWTNHCLYLALLWLDLANFIPIPFQRVDIPTAWNFCFKA